MPERRKSSLKIPNCCHNVPEVLHPREIKITGKIPSWLKGTIFGSGPGVFNFEKGSVKHWMDGFAMTTKYCIDGDRNSFKFSSKYVHSSSFKKAVKAKKPISPGYGTPPCLDERKGFFSKLMPFTMNDVGDNALGRVTTFGSSFYIFADSPTVFELNPSTLATGSPFSVYKTFGLNSISPEVLTDARTGDMYICGTRINPTFHYDVLRLPKNYCPTNTNTNTNKIIDTNPKLSVVGSVPSRWKFGPCGLRVCFTITENYIIFVEIPCIINLMRVAATWIKGYCMFDWIDWISHEKSRFYVMSKSGKVVKVEYLSNKAFMLPDILNAYEDGDNIVMDIVSLSNTALFEAMSVSNWRSLTTPKGYQPATIERYVIPLNIDPKKYSEGTELLSSVEFKSRATKGPDNKIILTPERLNENRHGFDYGIINSRFATRKYSFAYCVDIFPSVVCKPSPLTSTQCISKLHVNSDFNSKRKVVEWCAEPGFLAWKPVFVANPTGSKEDDGVLISIVTHMCKKQMDYLVIIDPQTMKEIARAEFLDCPVSGWLHGTYVPSLF